MPASAFSRFIQLFYSSVAFCLRRSRPGAQVPPGCPRPGRGQLPSASYRSPCAPGQTPPQYRAEYSTASSGLTWAQRTPAPTRRYLGVHVADQTASSGAQRTPAHESAAGAFGGCATIAGSVNARHHPVVTKPPARRHDGRQVPKLRYSSMRHLRIRSAPRRLGCQALGNIIVDDAGVPSRPSGEASKRHESPRQPCRPAFARRPGAAVWQQGAASVREQT